MFFTSNSNLIQILAIDFIKQLLILATWDIEHDYETSMMQIDKTEEEDDMADLSVMRGINNKKSKPGSQSKPASQSGGQKNLSRVGGFNYMINKDTIIDLENNIPFIYSDVNNQDFESDDVQVAKTKRSVTNIKKIYKDSTRFLSPFFRHHLVYVNTQKDIQLWRDVLKLKNERIKAIKKTIDVLKAFRIQYKGMSLFHHFAND